MDGDHGCSANFVFFVQDEAGSKVSMSGDIILSIDQVDAASFMGA